MGPNNETPSEAIASLQADWKKPRSLLPGLGYLNPLMVITTAAYGLFISSVLIFGAYQLFYGYFTGQGIDATPGQVISSGVFSLICALGAAGLMRRIALCLNIRRQTRQTTVIAEYKTDLTPVEVGVLVDAYSGDDEVFALLYQMFDKKILQLVKEDGKTFVVFDTVYTGLNAHEQQLIESVFQAEEVISLGEFRRSLPQLSEQIRQGAFARLQTAGYLPIMSGWQKLGYFIISAFAIAGGIFSVVLFGALFSKEVYTIGYPRYPVQPWELAIDGIILLSMILAPLQAYFSPIFSRAGLEKYREAAGLYLYVHTVLKDRFKDDNLAKSELEYYRPYAQAFGIDNTARRTIKKLFRESGPAQFGW